MATFINEPASLFNNDPKNPPDWIILDVWPLESVKSVHILSLNTFLSFVFCLVANNNSRGRSFPFLNLFLKSLLFYFWQQFSDFSVVYLVILHSLYCIQPFILFTELLLFLCKILTLFLLIFLTLVIYFLTSHKTQFVELLLNQHLILSVC